MLRRLTGVLGWMLLLRLDVATPVACDGHDAASPVQPAPSLHAHHSQPVEGVQPVEAHAAHLAHASHVVAVPGHEVRDAGSDCHSPTPPECCTALSACSGVAALGMAALVQLAEPPRDAAFAAVWAIPAVSAQAPVPPPPKRA